MNMIHVYLKIWKILGYLDGSEVEHLPLAQGAILESRDQVPRWAPGMEPASPPPVSLPLSLSLSLFLYHK